MPDTYGSENEPSHSRGILQVSSIPKLQGDSAVGLPRLSHSDAAEGDPERECRQEADAGLRGQGGHGHAQG